MAGYVFHEFEDVKVIKPEYRGSGEQDKDLDRRDVIIQDKEQIAGYQGQYCKHYISWICALAIMSPIY